MIKLIAFHGPYGSGKDTLGRAINNSLAVSRIFKFADPLYEMARVIDPAFSTAMSHEAKMAYVLDDPKYGTRRNFLERLGTDFMRNMIHPDTWIDHLENRLRNYYAASPFGTAIITDVRAENEAELVRKMGGVIVHLEPDWLGGEMETQHAITARLKTHHTDYTLPLYYGKVEDARKELVRLIMRES